MKSFFRTFFAVLLAFAVVAAVPLFLLIVAAVASFDESVPDDAWLTIQLSGELLEHYGPITLQNVLDEHPPCLMEITENLEKASRDDRIRGVIFRLDWFATGQGKLDEIRAGIRQVQEAGKPVYAYSWTARDASLYLGSECDEHFLFPKGWAYFLGRGVSIEHLKGVLDKLDVSAELHRIEDYKSASELFTTEESSPETLENLEWLFADLNDAYDRVLGKNLDLPAAELDALRERGILRADEAMEAGLVSELLYWDELVDRLGFELERSVTSAQYAEVPRAAIGLRGDARVAVVHAQGFVASGGDDRYQAGTGLTMGTDRVIDDLRHAREDRGIDAIIVRWDTGGGATDGGQRIAREVARTREVKPVIVSIADQAASAGYMMSSPASRIICPANGITGSIGSITGKFNLRGLWEKVGITFDDVAFAPNAFLLSELHGYTEAQRERIDSVHWATYEDWIRDIAQARNLEYEEVDSVARGRVWTGRQAHEHGLVDDLGHFQKAVEVTKEILDLAPSASISLTHYPEKPTIVDLITSGQLGVAMNNDLWVALKQTIRETARSGVFLRNFHGLHLR